MIRIELHQYLDRCPVFWRNFIKYIQEPYTEDTWLKSILNSELRRTGCKLIKEYKSDYKYMPYLEFSNDEDALAFILRWS